MKVGFIGQGYIGKNYADDFEARGYEVVRYSLEEQFIDNKEKIAECDVVFIAVPTPTTTDGFDVSMVKSAVQLVGQGKIAVIKSTIIPGTTEVIQNSRLDIIVLNSPEFLSEKTAVYDAAHPAQNIIGTPNETPEHQKAAEFVMSLLPDAPLKMICKSVEAEIFKYTHNINGYVQILLFNILFDVSKEFGADWEVIRRAIKGDPLMVDTYANPIHKSGRGAGGNCFIKDFAAFANLYESRVGDDQGIKLLRSLEEKNKQLLTESKKDLRILEEVYGKETD